METVTTQRWSNGEVLFLSELERGRSQRVILLDSLTGKLAKSLSFQGNADVFRKTPKDNLVPRVLSLEKGPWERRCLKERKKFFARGGHWNWNHSYLFNFRPFVKVKILYNSQLSRPSVRAVGQVAELVHGITKPGGGVGHLYGGP